jgi:hypothetical protein
MKPINLNRVLYDELRVQLKDSSLSNEFYENDILDFFHYTRDLNDEVFDKTSKLLLNPLIKIIKKEILSAKED